MVQELGLSAFIAKAQAQSLVENYPFRPSETQKLSFSQRRLLTNHVTQHESLSFLGFNSSSLKGSGEQGLTEGIPSEPPSTCSVC